MRIAINAALLSGQFSGVEYAILHLAQALAADAQFEYHIYVPRHAPLKPGALDGMAVTVPSWPLHRRALRIAWEQLKLPKLLEAEHIGLLHAAGYLAPLRTPCPVVLSVYDMIALQFPEWCTRSNALNYRLFLPASIRKADAIVVPSETTRSAVLARFPDADDKTTVVPLGISERFTRPDHEQGHDSVLSRHGIVPPYFLFVGQLEPKKNLPRLLEIYHALKQGGCRQRLVLAGRKAWGAHALEKQIRRLGLEDDVILPGYIHESELPQLFRAADLFLFPSLYEGFGIPPLEAMACGTPVVASDIGALREAIGDAGVLVDPRDTGAWVQAIRGLLVNSMARERLSKAGRARAATYTWARVAEQTEAIYARVLDARRVDGTGGAAGTFA